MKLLLPKQALFVLLFLLIFSIKTIGQTSTSGLAYIWSTPGTWTPTGIPASTTNVTVNSPLTLDQNLTISSGNYTFNQDVTDHPGGSDYNLTNLNASGSLTIASGTTTIGGITSIGGNSTFTLTVKNGATLVLGTFGSIADNFLIGNKVNINIELGATLIVYGNIINSNSTGSFSVNGLLQVYGDYKTDNGNIDVNGTTGQFYTTGGMQTQGASSTIYGSGNDCTSNCSGTSLGCGTGGTSYAATITPKNQTVCSGGTINTMTFSTSAPSATYQWEYSSSAGGTYIAISGATTNTYSPSALTVTTWYRVKYTSSASGCGTKYSAPVPVYVSASTYTQSTLGQSVCGGVFGPISVSALGTGLTYQWYSNTSANNSGGTLISGAVSNVFTPPSNTNGTKYYYCIINSSCGTAFTTLVSGAFTSNLNTAVTASPSQVACINAVMTNITHTTTGATGIGTATGLPLGVSATWSSNAITISGTPTTSGIFNYSIPLTGGCGSINATGTITVNANNTVAAATPSPILCINTVMTNITHATTGATGIGTATGLPLGVGATWSSNTITINGTPTTSGTFNYSIPLTGGCSLVNATGTIVVNTLPNNITNGFSATTICIGENPQLSFDAEDASFSVPYSITYKNDITLVQYTVVIPSASLYSFTPADNPTTNTGYTLVSISNATCTRTSGFTDPGSNVIVRPMPIATISGDTSVCVGDLSPNITFTNPQSVAVTVTYTVNSGASQLINIAANNTAAIAVATTTSSTYNYDLVSVAYQSAASCTNIISGRATVIVNPGLVASVTVASLPSTTICSGTLVTFTATAINGGTVPAYQWKLNGSNVGLNTPTYTNGSLVNSDVIVCIMTSNATPCLTASPATSNSITMIVNTTPTEPIVENVVQPTCATPTASVELSGLPVSGTWTVNPGGYTGTGTTTTLSGLAAATYNFTVSYSGCTSVSSAPVVINPLEIITYNGTNWNAAPTIDKVGEIQGSGSISANTELCSCTVNTGVVTTISTGVTLKLYDKLIVNGSLTFENNASLVQVNDLAINSGNIIYKRQTTPVNRYDYTYWSSPVKGQTLKQLSPSTLFDKYFSYDDQWKVSLYGVAIMDAGHGYIIRAPQAYAISGNPQPFTGVFTGVPNNNITPLALVSNKVYLLGNPYPSALDADQFLEYNSAVLQGTLYFWTHITQPVATGTSLIYKYNSNDYASYNRTGGTKAAVSGGERPTGEIAAGQGFFASASAIGGDLVFNNNMRLVGGSSGLNNSHFFKLSNTNKTLAAIVTKEKNRLWLNLTNKEGAFKQLLIGYITGATNNYDNGFDGVTYDSNPFVDFYSLNQGMNLAIQGRALPFYKQDSVSLGYKSTIQGEFQISIDQTDGVLESQQIFIQDKDLQVLHDLKKDPYSFKTEKGVFNNRFVLQYIDKNTAKISTAVQNPEDKNTEVIVSVQNNEISINSPVQLIDKVIFYDIKGRKIYQRKDIAEKVFRVDYLVQNHQVLMLRITLENNEILIKKIIY